MVLKRSEKSAMRETLVATALLPVYPLLRRSQATKGSADDKKRHTPGVAVAPLAGGRLTDPPALAAFA